MKKAECFCKKQPGDLRAKTMIKNGPNGKIISPIEIPVGKGIVGTVAATGLPEIIPDVTKDQDI